MTSRCKRLLLVLVMLCIPLQGLSAVLMPLCGQDGAANGSTMHHDHGAGHGHDGAAVQHHHDHESPGPVGLLCDSCGHCQQCLTMGLPAAPAEIVTVPPGDVLLPSLRTPTQHIPDRFQRPPLA